MSVRTRGPWAWSKRLGRWELVNERGYIIVMDFVRLGMNQAQPRFAERSAEDVGGLMHKSQDLDVSNHPDARLIAAAPELLEALENLRSQVKDTLIPAIQNGDEKLLAIKGFMLQETFAQVDKAIQKAKGV